MTFPRPFTLPRRERAHVTAGLLLLAEYIEQAPHVFRIQQDQRALLSPAEIRQVAAALNAPSTTEDAFQPFFYGEERETVRVGLLALADMVRLYGARATDVYFHEQFMTQGISVASAKDLETMMAHIEVYPAIEEVHRDLTSPHQHGETITTEYVAHVTHDSEPQTGRAPTEPATVYDPDIAPFQQIAPCM